ncbi:unnamed protein product [Calicophoron daubneyi]|uniref:Solute carrier family 35 member F2 n=1 Tax=Calicophoron daubneyi TaxID=300641 RepID=A0AAV2TFE8_CALDB
MIRTQDETNPPSQPQGHTQPKDEDKRKCRNLKEILLALFVGQLLAGFLGASGVCAALLAQVGVSLPLSQNLCHYSLIALIFGLTRLVLCRVRSKRNVDLESIEMKDQNVENFIEKPKRKIDPRWFLYITTGIVDMHAFWATLAAYAYTNVTSIQLLDCLGIPTSMVLSCFFLRYRYCWTHYLGAFVCLVGACMMIGADVIGAQETELAINGTTSEITQNTQTEVVIGDMLAVGGAVLFGISSVLQEYLTTSYGSTEYLAWFGLVAAVLSAIYSGAVENKQLTELFFNGQSDGKAIPSVAVLYYLGYSGSMFFLVSITAYTIVHLSAVLINLSLLTADAYGLIAGILLFHVPFHYLFFVAFSLIISGVILFAIRDAKTRVVK